MKYEIFKELQLLLRVYFSSLAETGGYFTRAIIVSHGVLLNHTWCQKYREFPWNWYITLEPNVELDGMELKSEEKVNRSWFIQRLQRLTKTNKSENLVYVV